MSQNPEQSAYNQLPNKRRKFVDEYVVDFNGAQAAIRAGYSPNGADRQAEFLLRIIEVKKAVEEKSAEIADRNQLKADDIINELKAIAFSKITEVVTWEDGKISIKNSNAIPEAALCCISEISETPTKTGVKTKIKLHNKISALELLGKRLGLFVDKVRHEGGDGLGIILHLNGKPKSLKDSDNDSD